MTYINRIRSTLGLVSVLLLAACTPGSGLDVAMLQEAEINNFRTPEATVIASGQPTAEQLEVAASAGVRHIINLRTETEEVDFNEAEVVGALGMEYHSIPIDGAAELTAENAATLAALLESLDGEPVLVHCASSNRVGGLAALTAHAQGASIDEAMAEGERWGLASPRLQEIMRDNLALQPVASHE